MFIDDCAKELSLRSRKKWGNATFHVRSIKSIEKSDCSLLISPIACSLNSTSSRAKVSGKNRVHTASMRNSFFDLARSARTLNSAWFKVAGYQMNQCPAGPTAKKPSYLLQKDVFPRIKRVLGIFILMTIRELRVCNLLECLHGMCEAFQHR